MKGWKDFIKSAPCRVEYLASKLPATPTSPEISDGSKPLPNALPPIPNSSDDNSGLQAYCPAVAAKNEIGKSGID